MAAPKFPGKGAKPGMYTMPTGVERYYSGGNDFYKSAPGGGAQTWGELTNGSGWRGMSQFDQYNDGRSKGGVQAQNGNPFAANFQAFYVPDSAPLRKVIGPNDPDPNKTPTPEPTVTPPSRDVAKADGSKGTQTSPGGGMPVLDAATAAAFLKSKGIGQGAYSSIQLPNTSTNPDSGIVPDAVPFGGQEVSITKNTLGAFTTADGATMPDLTGMSVDEAFTNPDIGKAINSVYSQYGGLSTGNGAPTTPTQGSKSYTEISPTDPIAAEAFGQDWVDSNKGKGGSSRLNAALADTAGMQSYMSKFGSAEDDKRRAADMAFLNAGTAQEGLRAKEAVLGQFHAGGQTYQLNDAGTELIQGANGKPLAMDSKAASAYRLGTMDSQTYKDSYKEGVKEATKETPAVTETPTTPKAGENPFAQNPAPATTAFPTDIPANTISTASEQGAQLIDTVKGMDFTPPMSPEQINNSFLNKREPLMRDPRNK